ncbi:hypothetical protein UlMin_037110 [Ulmus minor]
MASGSSKSIKMEQKPLMLKDYLLDDLSSCSSNGFNSFPRRQCCTTVRFLLEIELNHKQSTVNNPKRLPSRSRSRAAASITISALQRASDAVINAVKQLPFPSVKSSSVQNRRKGILPRSISKRFLKNRFWGIADNEGKDIKRLRLFGELLREQAQPSDQNTILTASTSSNSWWCDSEFTSETLGSSSCENDVVYSEQMVKKKVEITVGDDSRESETTTTASTCSSQNAKEWPNEEEKEQFSPVSVLDCPFEDEDETSTTSSPFNRNLARLEGTKRKLLQKIRRFENLSKLEPVDLEKRIAMSELEEEVESIHNSVRFDAKRRDEEEGEGSKEKARELVKLINNMANFHADNLLFDFFREAIMEETRANSVFNQREALEKAENWVSGKPCEVFLGWEVKERRKAYVRDMERGGRWNKFDEEKEEIGLDLEDGVWNILMKELLLDLVL